MNHGWRWKPALALGQSPDHAEKPFHIMCLSSASQPGLLLIWLKSIRYSARGWCRFVRFCLRCQGDWTKSSYVGPLGISCFSAAWVMSWRPGSDHDNHRSTSAQVHLNCDVWSSCHFVPSQFSIPRLLLSVPLWCCWCSSLKEKTIHCVLWLLPVLAQQVAVHSVV